MWPVGVVMTMLMVVSPFMRGLLATSLTNQATRVAIPGA